MFNKGKLFLVTVVLLLLAAVAPTFALEISVGGALDQYDNQSAYYDIQVEAGERITVYLDCVGGMLDPYLEVFGPNGFYTSDDDGGTDDWSCHGHSYSSGLSFIAPVSGVYTIVATTYPQHYDYLDQTNAVGNFIVRISGNFIPLFSYNADGRLNHGVGDLYAVLYAVQDSAGQPAIDVYCFTGETWSVTLSVTAGSGNASANGCAVDVFALADGAYQFNITTDGKLYSLVCSDLICAAPETSYFDPNE